MKKDTSVPEPEKIILQLYVAGMTARSMQAIERVTQFCETHFNTMFELDIIDIYKHPQLAVERGIVFSPSLIKQHPQPRKVIIGDFSKIDNLMRMLGVPYSEE